MSRFHKPRFPSAIVLTLLCINPTSASPVRDFKRPSISIVAASAPVHIIPIADLPPGTIFPTGSGTTSYEDNGDTLVTTYGDPGTAVAKRRLDPITSETEPVNIIPIEDFPPDTHFPTGGGTTSYEDNGETQVTTYNIPPRGKDKRRLPSITNASAPVNVIPIDDLPDDTRNLLSSAGSSTTHNDGTTFTTVFQPSPKNKTATTNGVDLVNLNTQTVASPGINMGLNCQGSAVMCVGANNMGVMHTLRDYMYAIPDGYRYYDGQNIACMKHTVYPYGWFTWGFYCAFMQGNIPADGFDGAVIQLKMQQMIEHHCLGCGSVPFSPDNDPNTLGILTVNYVRQSECEGLCYYVPPGTPAKDVKVPKGMTLGS